MPWGPGNGRTRTGSGRSGARGASPGVAAGVLARRDRDSVGGSRGRGARPCLSPNRMAAAPGGALRGPRLRPPHPPAGGASFAVGQDVVARGGSCKGERCHGLGTVLPVASPAHGDEPPRGRQAPSTTTSPREGPGAFVSGLPASAAPPQTACHSGDRTRPADVPALASRAHRDTPVAPSLYPSGLPAAPLPPQLTCPSRGQAWRRTGRPGRG